MDTRPPHVHIGASTKLYLDYRQSISWLCAIRREVDMRPQLVDSHVVPFVVPSFPLLDQAVRMFRDTPVRVGAQNVAAASGAQTGEVSARMLAQLGVDLVEIGHAERRLRFHEDDDVVREKVVQARDAGLRVLLCVGEASRANTESAAKVVVRQINSGIAGPISAGDVVIAYEPVWAIGAVEPAPPNYVNDVVNQVREELGRDVTVVYGGSARPGLLAQLPTVDGVFLGRYAHDPVQFGRSLDEAAQRVDTRRAIT